MRIVQQCSRSQYVLLKKLRSVRGVIKNKGFTLVEISIVLLIVSVLAIGIARTTRDKNATDRSAAIATHLKNVTGGVNTYISSNFDPLVAGTAIPGFAIPLAPTVTELKTAGYLAQNVQTTNLAGTNWLTQISKTPTGCVAPACDLNAIVYSDKGFFNLLTASQTGCWLRGLRARWVTMVVHHLRPTSHHFRQKRDIDCT